MGVGAEPSTLQHLERFSDTRAGCRRARNLLSLSCQGNGLAVEGGLSRAGGRLAYHLTFKNQGAAPLHSYPPIPSFLLLLSSLALSDTKVYEP